MLIGTASACASGGDDAQADLEVHGGDIRADGASSTGRLLLWQGFSHVWERRVAGFLVPHRISRFENSVSSAMLLPSPSGNELVAQPAQFHFAQDTGVDGNYMHPVGRYVAVSGNELEHVEDQITLVWTDRVKADGTASATFGAPITVHFSRPIESDRNATMLLRGLSLRTECKDDQQPEGFSCNSHGIWPYQFGIHIDSCSTHDTDLDCRVRTTIGRAWTPNDGGIRGIEIKPLNQVTQFTMELRISAIAGPASALSVGDDVSLINTVRARSNASRESNAQAQAPAGTASAAWGVRGFEFIFLNDNEDPGRAGRYIGGMTFGVEQSTWSANTGVLTMRSVNNVVLPDTVANTNVSTRLRVQPLYFLSGATTATDVMQVESRLCINSKPQAPLITRWERCTEEGHGEPTSSAVVQL